jgi:NADPH-dependent 2,4-dienoyl-CoA reductase/sulfur reductase-like enzyme
MDTAEFMTKVRAGSVVVAQGAYEQPAVFRGNDLPGVMLATAAQRLMYRYAVAPASRVVVLTANQQGYAAALDGAAHGIKVVAVLDLREKLGSASEASAMEVGRRSIPVQVLGISGPDLNALLRQIGVSVLAWPRLTEIGPGVTLWIDPSFAHYFWTTLLEVARATGVFMIGGPNAAGK